MSFLIQGAASGLLNSLLGTQTSPSASQQTPVASNAASASSATNPFANLSLTAQEQSQIRSILQTAASQHLSFAQIENKISGVLSTSQQQALQSDLQAFGSSHHHHGGHGSGGRSSSSSIIGSGTDAFGVSNTTPGSPSPTAGSSLFSDLAAQLAFQPQSASEL